MGNSLSCFWVFLLSFELQWRFKPSQIHLGLAKVSDGLLSVQKLLLWVVFFQSAKSWRKEGQKGVIH